MNAHSFEFFQYSTAPFDSFVVDRHAFCSKMFSPPRCETLVSERHGIGQYRGRVLTKNSVGTLEQHDKESSILHSDVHPSLPFTVNEKIADVVVGIGIGKS